ncbi:MAG TPA: peptidylprolyl isomerase [Gammaproteobacteria bacterium]|nr:peptidylprolyl isomerase [Gammaproteobacteria bacterium]
MRPSLTVLLSLVLLAACSQAPVQPATAPAPVPVPPHPLVKIETNYGDITVQLDGTRAPLSVRDFLTYVSEHYYDGSSFYRVVPGFVIQGGDYTSDLKYHQPKHDSIPNESGNGLSNLRGSIAMARDTDPHSANATFYINLADNRRLDPRPDRWGYAVFGQVVAGMDVVDKIAAVPTGTVTLDDPGHDVFNDVPAQPVTIIKVTLLPDGRP